MFDSMGSILEALSPEQQIACSTQNNILLTACPGSGKTRTLTHRLAYQVLRDPASKKIKIAITYTNRAAEEITNRLEGMNIDQSSIWAGTIHQFCMHFIIRPYAMYSKRLCKGYRIIDDYSKKAYGREIAERLGMHLNYYDDPFQYENVRTEYKRVLKEKKEIDFDAILLISEELLASCAFIGSNIASVISSILVDEFQDTNELQYSILSTIYKANKSIILMFVGDVNQAIYSSLGGVAKGKKELETLYEINFDSLSLKGCYRSTQRLVDLYSRFEISKTDAHSVAKYKDEHGEIHFFDSVYYTDLASKIAELIKKELRKGTKAEEICVIAPQWFMLFDLSGKLRLLLPDISFDAPDISPIKYNPMNPLFLIAKLLFMPAGKNVKLRKRIAIEFISIIRDDFRIMVPDDVQSYDVLSAVNCCRHIDADGITCLEAAIEKVFALLNIRISTGRVRGTDDVIAYHVRQSFRPGEITPEEANRLGVEFAKRFTKGNHAFVVCTHIDKSHIHNHIIWSAVNADCDRKFRNFWGSTRAVRRLSDTICIENGLSIVENPKPHGKSYNKWLGEQAKPSHREQLRVMIDRALEQKPADFDALLKLLTEMGCEVSRRGKAIRLKAPGWKNVARMDDKLGAGYSEAEIRAVLAGEKQHTPRKKSVVQPEPPKVNLLVDIQAKLQAGKGAGYVRWAKVFNLKQMAQTVNFLTEHRLLDYAELAEKAAAATAHHNELSVQIKAAEKRMAEIAVLRTHIINYAKTRETYVAYRKAGYSRKFREEHEEEILLHQAAKNAFDEMGVKKLPKVKDLQAEYAKLLEEKKKTYAEYRHSREEMRELLTAKANVDRVLKMEVEQDVEKEKDHGQR